LGVAIEKPPIQTDRGLGDTRIRSLGEELNLIQIQKWSFDIWLTSPPAAPLLTKEKFKKILVPLLGKERLGEAFSDHAKLQFSTWTWFRTQN
jgi:hypothetical protein